MLFTKAKPKDHITSLENSDISIDNSERTKELLKLCQLSKQDIAALKKIDDIMEEHAAIIADRHYNMIMMIPEIKEIFENNTNYEGYVSLITLYYKQLTKPELDVSYIEYRRKIGRIHSRIHLSDEWFLGSYIRVYEYLIPLIVARFHSKPGELMDILTALNRIITFDSLIVLGAYQEANDFYLVENINKVMESVIGADKVSKLLDEVASTVTETSSISDAAKELSDSVHQVAENATSVSSNTVKMIEDSQRGHDIIQSSLNGFLRMADDFTTMEKKISHLTAGVQQITQVVELIQNVADETNLLALNASIEAARAGESGRGFSVVASEVRGLAEQTKKSVNQISAMIEEMQKDAKDVGKTVEAMSSTLTGRAEQANDSIDVMKQIMDQIKEVGDSTGNIAAIAEEQSAATEDITDRILLIHDHTEKIKEQSHTTGRSIYDASVEVDELRKEVIGVIPELTSGQLLRVVKTEHRLYGWWLYNKLLGFQSENRDYENNKAACKLGKWIEQMKMDYKEVSKTPSFKALEKIHADFHNKMGEVYQLAEAGEMAQANKEITEFEVVSSKIIVQIDTLQKEIQDY